MLAEQEPEAPLSLQQEPALIAAPFEASHDPDVIEALLIDEHFDMSHEPEVFIAPALEHFDMSHEPFVIAACLVASQVPEVIEAFFPAEQVAEHEEPAAVVAAPVVHEDPFVMAALVPVKHFVTSHEPLAFCAEALDASQLAEQAALSPVEVRTAFVAACSVAVFLTEAFFDEQALPSHA